MSWILGISFVLSSTLDAQQVKISNGINIRNDFAYFILGRVEDNILLYRDKGFEQKLVAFDTTMQYKWEQQIRFDSKKIRLFGIEPRDSFFNVYFGFKEKGHEYIKVNRYNGRADLIDSTVIFSKEDDLITHPYEFASSEDGSQSLLYYIESQNYLRVFGLDNDSLRVYWEDEFEISNTNLNKELIGIHVTNHGGALLLLEKNNTNLSKDEHFVEVIYLSNKNHAGAVSSFSLRDKVSQDLFLSYDNLNQRVVVIGLYNEKKSNWSQGIYYANFPLNEIGNPKQFMFRNFSDELLYDVYGRDATKRNGLTYYKISDIVWRQDGGILLIAEMQREFSRRSNYDTAGRSAAEYYGIRGWTDFYNEDIVVMSIHPDGEIHWNKVLYKKQFSQDDGGVFSSYFLFRTPSRLRIIFNDEIRNNNTVSEYLLNPMGKHKRESLLSTEYQKLKLRFRDAMQLSNTEILVPSERSNNLSLVKITY